MATLEGTINHNIYRSGTEHIAYFHGLEQLSGPATYSNCLHRLSALFVTPERNIGVGG
jgi:hypothetical protein